jgi:hypothetical protein
MAVNVWQHTAALLEADAPPDLDRQIARLIRRRPWLEVGAILADTHRELSHGRSTEAEAVTWAASLVHVLRPQGWEQAPKGAELEAAILEAWRPTSGTAASHRGPD